jgi:hypothetical protein
VVRARRAATLTGEKPSVINAMSTVQPLSTPESTPGHKHRLRKDRF